MRANSLREEEIARLESAVSRLGNVEELIEMRLAEIRDRQAQQNARNSDQLVDLAERMDFAERVIAQQRPIDRLKPPRENGAATPV